MNLEKKQLPLLDLLVGVSNGMLYKNLFVQSSDCNDYLDYKSSYLEYNKKSIICSQTLRLTRVFSFEKDFNKHKGKMES